MKNKIIDFAKKNKKYLVVLFIGLLLILAGYIYWDVYLSKIEIFKKEETKLQKAAERYYSFRKQYLPKDGGYKTITLQELYDNVEMDDLYVPKTKEMCNPESWVKVYNDKNNYKYIVYLECGKYKSKVDHEGPKITLNGTDTLYVARGSKYEELGVKEVNDYTDGKIDTKNVVIDSSKVNTLENGEYEVTYTVHDSTYNETVAIRKIIVAQGLGDTVRQSVNSEGYYQGNANNYVLFSGMLWRIVKINENGTIKITLAEPSSNLRINYTKYENSNVDKWLNDYFYKYLTNPDNYIIDTEFCVGNINSIMDYSNYCSEKVTRKVGLLDINEYYKTIQDGISSVQSNNFMLSHLIGDKYVEAPFIDSQDGIKNSILAPIRPVITIKNGMNIIKGDGSYKNPYKLNDYETAEKGSKIGSRLVGEYLEYSGLIFRIIDKDENNNIKVISAEEWNVKPSGSKLFISTENLDKWVFDPKEDNNPGYVMNNEFIDYLDAKKIISSTYEVPINVADKNYDKYKTNKVKAKVVLPKTYDLFSSIEMADEIYAYIDTSSDTNNMFIMNTTNARVFEINKDDFQSYSMKIVTTLDGDQRIEKGLGIARNPYVIK